jgi:superfamily II DNA or RNA helicase
MTSRLPVALTRQAIAAATGERAFQAGAQYVREGRVLKAERIGETEIVATVRGSDKMPYTQTITLDGRAIDGYCTCPVGFNCKHVAAAMLKLLERGPLIVTGPGDIAPKAGPALSRHPAPALGSSQTSPAAAPKPNLSPDLRLWLDRLKTIDTEAQEAASAGRTLERAQRVIYVLSSERQGRRLPMLSVRVLVGRLLKNGEVSASAQSASLDSAFTQHRPAYLTAEDAQIFRLLKWSKHELGFYFAAKSHVIAGAAGAEVLSAILATGRARLQKINGLALMTGPARPARFVWQEDDDGAFWPDLTAPDEASCLSTDPAIYLDPANGDVGPLDAGLPAAQLRALLTAPPVSPAAAVELRSAMAKAGPQLAALAPPPPRPVEQIVARPVPQLVLMGLDVAAESHDNGYGRRRHRQHTSAKERIGVARLRFLYPEEIVVPLGETRSVLRQRVNGRLFALVRDTAHEADCFTDLLGLGFDALDMTRSKVPKGHEDDLEPGDGQDQWIDFLLDDLPDLQAKGWQVDITDSFPVRIAQASGDMSVRIGEAVRDSSGIDWFNLDCGVLVDGVAVDLTDAIANLIRARSWGSGEGPAPDDGENFLLPLPDGRLLSCPVDRMKAMMAGLLRLFDGAPSQGGKGGPLRFKANHSADLAELEAVTAGLGVVWTGAERLRTLGLALRAAMADGGSLPAISVPEGFLARLRSYQQTGLNWLGFLRSSGFGAVLADDMGLGKTVQTLALLAVENAAGRLDKPALVVAPTSLLGNWQREAAHFVPGLKVMVSHGLERKKGFGAFTSHDLVITSYPLVARDHAVLNEVHWSVLVLDEAQLLKNPDAETTQRIDALKADWRLALSGTPVQNNLTEIWSLFHLINKGLLGERKAFQSFYRTPIEKKGDAQRSALLARRVRPFILRRTKAEVARDLPPKTEITETVELEGAQRDLYETIRLAMQKKVRDALARQGLARSHIIVLDALLKLRQAALDPRLVKGQEAKAEAGSAKLRRLMELLTILAAEQRRVVVFSQFTSMLDLIEEQLDAGAIGFVRLDGQSRDRTELTRQFQDGDAPVFLVSLKAGGVGLNLTAADTVILFDPWWNPAVEDQAIDRVHRIGQGKPVFVHRLVATGTVEEKMDALKAKKRQIAASLFDADGQITGALTEADLEELLG